jgi:hypothetical protein
MEGRADSLCGVTWRERERERESDRRGSEEADKDGGVYLEVVVVVEVE